MADVGDAGEPHLGSRYIRGDLQKTGMGWEIDPEGLAVFLRRMARDYVPGLPLYVTENGMVNADMLNAAGDLHDPERVAYFEGHLAALASPIDENVP